MILYKITNLVNGREYYGQTKRTRLLDRWREHLYPLRNNSHYNKHLQAAWNKYGEESFNVSIVAEFSTKEELNKAEISIIGNSTNSYNLAKGGNGFSHSDKAKMAIGEASRVPVVGMSISTGEIREYACVKDTGLDGFNSKNIGKCCKFSICEASGRIQQAISTGKWVWMYKSEFDLDEMGRRAERARTRGGNDSSRPIMGKSLLDRSIINFRSCSEASRHVNADKTHIRAACLWKDCRSAAQHIWVFADEPDPSILLEKRYAYALDTFNGHKVIGPRSKRASGIKA